MFFLFLLQANYLAINTADRNNTDLRLLPERIRAEIDLSNRIIDDTLDATRQIECLKKVQKGIIIFLGASTMYTAGLYTAMFTQLNCPKCKQD